MVRPARRAAPAAVRVAAGRTSRWSTAAAPLRVPAFRWLAGGQLASTVGDLCYAVALPWLVLSHGGGPALLGLVLAAYGIPRTALIPLGGVLADRWGPRTVMLGADAVRVPLLALLALATLHGRPPVPPLLLVAAAIGAAEGVFIPASFAIAPDLLPGPQLAAGNALLSMGTQLGTLAGPALGGLLVAWLGPSPAFAVDAATFAVSAATLARIPPRQAELVAVTGPTAPDPRRRGLLALIRASRVLQVLLLITVAANLAFGGLAEVALPALAHGPLRAGAAGYGALLAGVGAGALLGTVIAGQLGALARPALVAAAAFLVEAAATALAPDLGGLPGAIGALVVFGLMSGLGNVVLVTVIQRWAPPELLGRLMAAITLAGFGVFPLSVALAGVLVARLGPQPYFLIAAATLALAVGAGLGRSEFRDLGRTVRAPDAL